MAAPIMLELQNILDGKNRKGENKILEIDESELPALIEY